MKELDDIIDRFKTIKDDYEHFINKLDYTNRDTLTHFETQFNGLMGDMVFIAEPLFRLRTIHDDKAASAKKSIITKRYSGEEKSFTKCETYAAADDEYLTFLKDRSTYYSKWELFNQIRNSIEHYLREIAHRLK
jgi:hypothetical protein